ncbi:MAG: hypothetical protein V5A68_02780 [Candidatus Thermoplasmatota archaeon]
MDKKLSGKIIVFSIAFLFVANASLVLAQPEDIFETEKNADKNSNPDRPWNNISKEVWDNKFDKDVDKAFNHSGWNFTKNEIKEKKNEWKNKFQNLTDKKVKDRFNQSEKIIKQFKQKKKIFGSINYEDGFAAGDLIHFMFDENNGTILSYTFNQEKSNIVIFDSIKFDSFTQKEKPISQGAVWRCTSKNVKLEAHDNPTGLLKIKNNEEKTIYLNLGDNVTISPTNLSNNIYPINGDITGKIIIADVMADEKDKGSTIEIKDNGSEAVVSLANNSNILFLASPAENLGVGIPQEYENQIHNAIGKGKIAARIRVQKGNQSVNETYSEKIKMETGVGKGKVEIKINSSDEKGKTIVLDVDSDTINVSDISQITVKFDGENISMADDYQDILNVKDDGNNSEYLIMKGSNGWQTLISIPSFSTHTVTIASNTGTDTQDKTEEKGTPGFEVFLLILAITMFFYLKRKR